MKKLKLTEIAKRVDAHLKRFEADPEINARDEHGTSPYHRAYATRAGSRMLVKYVSYRNARNLRKEDALTYLNWLDAGNTGKHYVCFREAS